jgi:hypothetical protein
MITRSMSIKGIVETMHCYYHHSFYNKTFHLGIVIKMRVLPKTFIHKTNTEIIWY